MNHKNTFRIIFIYLSLALLILPFILTFNDVLTKFFERFVLYNFLQDKVVPLQTALVGLFVHPLGISYVEYKDGMLVNGVPMKIAWNCLGWQSLVLFAISSLVGLSGKNYTLYSKLKTLILGFLGLFWINIFRMVFIVYLGIYAAPIYAFVFHDVLAAIVSILWLFVYWWFAYSYILEQNKDSEAV